MRLVLFSLSKFSLPLSDASGLSAGTAASLFGAGASTSDLSPLPSPSNRWSIFSPSSPIMAIVSPMAAEDPSSFRIFSKIPSDMDS